MAAGVRELLSPPESDLNFDCVVGRLAAVDKRVVV